MFLFKASGATYHRVRRQAVHAFPVSPAEVHGDEFVLLSKNREDCRDPEKQVQYVAKLLQVRPASSAELEEFFPGVEAGKRWRYAAELYWVRQLPKPFNLSAIPGFDARHYSTVQGFAKLSEPDALALLHYLQATNSTLLLDIVNSAERPDPSTG